MNGKHQESDGDGYAMAETPIGIDWRTLSSQRLDRLVAMEHDCSLMRDRVTATQADYRQLFALSEDRQRRIRELEGAMTDLEGRLLAACNECDQLRASLSWRITRPLRVLSNSRRKSMRIVRSVLRPILRKPVVRHLAGAVARRSPGLYRRIHSVLSDSPID